jgi:hypothetical protein
LSLLAHRYVFSLSQYPSLPALEKMMISSLSIINMFDIRRPSFNRVGKLATRPISMEFYEKFQDIKYHHFLLCGDKRE